MRKNNNRLDPIAILREELMAAAVAHGANRCEELANNVVQRYMSRLGGSMVYVRTDKAENNLRDAEEIYSRFDGTNARALALEFGKSARTIQRIILAKRAERRNAVK